MRVPTILSALDVPGDAAKWRALGFMVDGGLVVSHVEFALGADEMGWGFESLNGDAAKLGVPTRVAPAPADTAPKHPNGIDEIDHVVYAVPDLDDAIETLNALLDDTPRRRAKPRGPQGPEMAFYRVGDVILEVVGSGRPPALHGVAFSCPDLDATVAAMRDGGFESVGDPKTAVQGGRIASVWRGWVGMPVAIMQPRHR